MKRIAALALALLSACITGACGGSADASASGDFPAMAYAAVASETGELSIEVRTSPEQPLDRGVATVLFTIKDREGVPVEGLQIAVTPWMPAMAHGSSLRPTVSAQSGGRYVIGNLGLYMPGQWQLRTSIAGAREDRATPTIEVR
jgi:hypothetical protein